MKRSQRPTAAATRSRAARRSGRARGVNKWLAVEDEQLDLEQVATLRRSLKRRKLPPGPGGWAAGPGSGPHGGLEYDDGWEEGGYGEEEEEMMMEGGGEEEEEASGSTARHCARKRP